MPPAAWMKRSAAKALPAVSSPISRKRSWRTGAPSRVLPCQRTAGASSTPSSNRKAALRGCAAPNMSRAGSAAPAKRSVTSWRRAGPSFLPGLPARSADFTDIWEKTMRTCTRRTSSATASPRPPCGSSTSAAGSRKRADMLYGPFSGTKGTAGAITRSAWNLKEGNRISAMQKRTLICGDISRTCTCAPAVTIAPSRRRTASRTSPSRISGASGRRRLPWTTTAAPPLSGCTPRKGKDSSTASHAVFACSGRTSAGRWNTTRQPFTPRKETCGRRISAHGCIRGQLTVRRRPITRRSAYDRRPLTIQAGLSRRRLIVRGGLLVRRRPTVRKGRTLRWDLI